ncbi:hypothetical protein F3Y22_tig00111463pilonHSYRG00155 [Hibiscus syriacus]|uniref:Uncharacterized protein n=1 Tax=Hibiscus syriacus TaxID=106335 RepID=A0A6A2YIB5_HIBSY|nr:hypothetical protein F3Y22_tig00111463pilonHSYRG00155 [Hibiscus syriacus]
MLIVTVDNAESTTSINAAVVKILILVGFTRGLRRNETRETTIALLLISIRSMDYLCRFILSSVFDSFVSRWILLNPEDASTFPMVLVQIPMCNERKMNNIESGSKTEMGRKGEGGEGNSGFIPFLPIQLVTPPCFAKHSGTRNTQHEGGNLVSTLSCRCSSRSTLFCTSFLCAFSSSRAADKKQLLKAVEHLNVVPDSITIGGAFRAFSKESFVQLKHRIEEVITKQASVHRCTAKVTFDEKSTYPVVFNDKELHEHFRQVAEKMLGVQNIAEARVLMGAEDFAF